jgi:hypothetical protein
MSFWSSSGVHGPFFSPNLSQHGALPMIAGLAKSALSPQNVQVSSNLIFKKVACVGSLC